MPIPFEAFLIYSYFNHLRENNDLMKIIIVENLGDILG